MKEDSSCLMRLVSIIMSILKIIVACQKSSLHVIIAFLHVLCNFYACLPIDLLTTLLPIPVIVGANITLLQINNKYLISFSY